MESSGYWLDGASEEFEQICYQLGITLNSRGTFADVEVWKIENAELLLKFEKSSAKLLKVSTWTVVETLGEKNSLNSICSDGFRFPRGGMMFSTGKQDLNLVAATNKADHKCTLVFSEIAVGKAFVVDRDPSGMKLPEGYDSFYVTKEKLDRNDDGEFSLAEYRAAANFEGRAASDYVHTFFLKNSGQVCPKYIVRFSFQPLPEGESFLRRSSFPQDVATKNRLSQFEYFDWSNFQPVDMKNKITTVDNIRQVVTVSQAYEMTTELMFKKDPILDGKQQWLESQLDTLDEKVRAINLNYAEIGETLRQTYEAAVARLQVLTREKLEIVLSLEIELRRQQEQIGWMEKFIQQQRQVTDAGLNGKSVEEKNILKLQFLKLWKCHSLLHNNLGRIKSAEKHWQALNDVRPDIKAVAEMHVYCDTFNRGEEATFVRSPSAFGTSALLGASSPMPTGSRRSRSGKSESSRSRRSGKAISGTGFSILDENDGEDDEDDGSSEPDGPWQAELREASSHVGSFMDHAKADARFATIAKSDNEQLASALEKFLEAQCVRIQDILDQATSAQQEAPSNTPIKAPVNFQVPLPASIVDIAGESYHMRLPHSLSTNMAPKIGVGSNSKRPAIHRGPHIDPRTLFMETLAANIGIALPSQLEEEAEAAADLAANQASSLPVSEPVAAEPSEEKQSPIASSRLSRSNSASTHMSISPSVASSKGASPSHKSVSTAASASRKPINLPRPAPLPTQLSTKLANLGFAAPPVPAQGLTANTQSKLNLMASVSASPADDQSVSPMSRSQTNSRHGDDPEIRRDEVENFVVTNEGNFSLPLPLLLKTAEQFHSASSMFQISQRKKQQLISRNMTGFQKGLTSLRISNILDQRDAETVYFSLPFLAKPPGMKLLYSSVMHKRALSELYMKCLQHRGPCVLLLRSGDFVFGAYLSHSIHLSGGWAGGPACFLFSLTLDVKMAYHARSLPAASNGASVAFLVERDQLTIGNGDLIIASSLLEGICDLEQCFGVGLAPGSPEAKAFLAGSPEFTIEDIEVWAVV